MKKALGILVIMITIFSSVVLAVNYTDLSTEHWAYKPIKEMTEKGILSGYPDGSFAPDNVITRAEFAKILVLALNLNQSSSNVVFDDVSENYWAYNYIQIASRYLSGYTNGTSVLYMPDDNAVREDMAVAIVNAAGLQNMSYNLSSLNKFSDKDLISENIKKYVAIAVENGLMNGNADGTFNPKGGLTRAEVSMLITNTMEELEKIAINDIDKNEIELPSFKYDEETGTINLGQDWQEYYYSYNTKNKISQMYEPKQRELSYRENGEIGINFSGNYVFVISKRDTSVYKTVKISNPFKGILFDFEQGEIDLGSKWGKYLYAYTYSPVNESSPNKYIPSQRVLKYNGKSGNEYEDGYKLNDHFQESEGVYITVYLRNNPKLYINQRITAEDIELYRMNVLNLPNQNIQISDIEYDEETGTINLGQDWQEYYYSYNTKNEISQMYEPKQRELSYRENGEIGKNFSGNYVFVISKEDTSIYQTIKVSNPFSGISFDFEQGEIDLGSKWGKYLYAYTYSPVNESSPNKYIPSQRVLKYNGKSGNEYKDGYEINGQFQESEGIYITVYLRNNPKLYINRLITAEDISLFRKNVFGN